MNAATIAKLRALNAHFYREAGLSFGQRRQSPWTGWKTTWQRVSSRPGFLMDGVLDLGCGNGRLGAFLNAQSSQPLRWIGVEQSWSLLKQAQRAGSDALIRADLMAPSLPLHGHFSLVALCAVLHHVPSRRLRRRLLAAAFDQVRPGGVLLVTFWRFLDCERQRSKIRPWSLLQGTPWEIDPAQLESGDRLLSWETGEILRYCHGSDATERKELIQSLPSSDVDEFDADGREGNLNHYVLVWKPAESS